MLPEPFNELVEVIDHFRLLCNATLRPKATELSEASKFHQELVLHGHSFESRSSNSLRRSQAEKTATEIHAAPDEAAEGEAGPSPEARRKARHLSDPVPILSTCSHFPGLVQSRVD